MADDTISSTTFTERLKFIRCDLLHLKQEEMVLLLDISHSSYSKLETGLLAPSSKMLQRLSKKLSISANWLENGAGRPPQNLTLSSLKRHNDDGMADREKISDSDLEKIIEMALNPELTNLAQEIAKTTGGNAEGALADIIAEKFKKQP